MPAVMASLSVAHASQHPDSRQPYLSAAGALHTDSPGGAVLRVRLLAPGHSATGMVTVFAADHTPPGLELAQTAVRDHPGPHGGALSNRLILTVEDITSPRDPKRYYRGPLDALGTRQLPSITAGGYRTYRFSILFPDGGTPPSPSTGDNAYQGSSVATDFHWTSGTTN